MPAEEYIPILSATHGNSYADYERKDTVIRRLRILVFVTILIIVSIILAHFVLSLINNDGSGSNDDSLVQLKSFAGSWTHFFSVLSHFSEANDVLRLPIHGEFQCEKGLLDPSTISPIDANRVRPADVKYIAAMGDSYATGFRSYSTSGMEGASNDTRNIVGNSFIMGGDGSFEDHLTLANVFRHLNPSLIGSSTGIGLQETETNLNVAMPGMWANDMPRQARELIRRFNKYPSSSIREDWKLINIFIGTRDITGYCLGQGGTNKAEYKGNITEAIQILQEALPKTIISIIGMTNLDFMWRTEIIVKGLTIPCAVGNFELLAQRRIEEYREVGVELVSYYRHAARKDHAVIIQHIFDDLWIPLRNDDNSFNAEFYSSDSFHLSNYGNSLVAKQLWNHLVSPDHRKITNNMMMSDDSSILFCPEPDCPFIRTPANSVGCS
ncbi:hypothetical protein PFISCL1PPCAC_26145 [Pristionchus fissidentatus]|uniref:Lipase n=1 Tax=Pristionchus fissidentatus TaxID=1538716 RepID=A0AAV5WU51_9BILA|nr:hypothetical protein PFISCL1PPCAC_26145 [Pristionchus fissidentatus]